MLGAAAWRLFKKWPVLREWGGGGGEGCRYCWIACLRDLGAFCYGWDEGALWRVCAGLDVRHRRLQLRPTHTRCVE